MNSTEKILEVDIIPQQKEHWCYAAISQMLINYYNKLNSTTGGKYIRNKFKKNQQLNKYKKIKTKKNKKNKKNKKIKIGGTVGTRKRKAEYTSINTEVDDVNTFLPAISNDTYKNEQFNIAMKICNNNIEDIDKDQDPYEYLNKLEIINNCNKGNPSWNLVVQNINSNNPLIVLIGVAKNAHYLLLIGYNGKNSRDNNRTFIYIDPYSGKQIIQYGKNPIILKYDESDGIPFENSIIGYCTTTNPNIIIDINI